MWFYLKCSCGATTKARGEDDPDTNGAEVTDFPNSWEGGSPTCTHEGYEIAETECDDPEPTGFPFDGQGEKQGESY